jgi:hypothetical protein
MADKELRKDIFISYSHANEEFLTRLLLHLVPLKRHRGISAWSDREIAAGDQWETRIEEALRRCQVAVLLVSPDFLASRFINERELPPIEAAATKENVPILWLLVRPCLWKEFDFLRRTQSAVALTPCLASLERWQQDQVFVDLCEKIEASAWQLQIELEDTPSESELALTLPGKAKYTAPKAENQPQELSSFLVQHDLAIVPFVLIPRNGWYSQVWARPDQNGAF